MSLNVAVVGLGRIGSSYDGGNVSETPRTHIGAILGSNLYSLTAACDSNLEACRRFTADWRLDIPLYASVEQLLLRHSPDLVVVAVSLNEQFPTLKTVLSKSSAMIFCEKPFCADEIEARKIEKIASQKGVPVIVNFHRQWEARFCKLQAHIRELGTPSLVTAVYGKGTINYGAHLIDLLVFLFGSISHVQADLRVNANVSTEDVSLSCRLWFKSGFDARLIGLDDVGYELFEVDIFYPDRKIEIELGGYEIRELEAKEGIHYPRYVSLREVKDLYERGPVAGLKDAYSRIAAFARSDKSEPNSLPNASTSTYVHHVLRAIRSSSQTGRRLSL
ncbi:MAG: Gfo/Idh/MocA family protein [Methylovirgula sp.]